MTRAVARLCLEAVSYHEDVPPAWYYEISDLVGAEMELPFVAVLALLSRRAAVPLWPASVESRPERAVHLQQAVVLETRVHSMDLETVKIPWYLAAPENALRCPETVWVHWVLPVTFGAFHLRAILAPSCELPLEREVARGLRESAGH